LEERKLGREALIRIRRTKWALEAVAVLVAPSCLEEEGLDSCY